MLTKVIKRDGHLDNYDPQKITTSIEGANERVKRADRATTDEINQIIQYIETLDRSRIKVEDIQDIIEEQLVNLGKYRLAKSYITYRYKKSLARDQYNTFMKTIGEKLKAENVQNQNANVDEKSFGGRVGEATRVMTKKYALDYCMSDMAKANHINNEIYIHDLDSYAAGQSNCLSIPFDDLLAKGFNTRQTDVRPANSINTALQLVAVIFQLQSLQQFGGVSATHLDWTLVPYVKKSFYKHYLDGLEFLGEPVSDDFYKKLNNEMSIEDELYKQYTTVYNFALKMTIKETYQAVEGMYHNLNTLQSRSGNQLPFTSINYGTCTSPEGRLVIKALLDTSIKGIGKLHKTSIFPCGIFQLGEGINKHPGDPNYDLYKLALKSTAQRLYPNFANINWSAQSDWENYDVRMKQRVLDSLSKVTKQQLIEKLQANPELKDLLGIDIELEEGDILK